VVVISLQWCVSLSPHQSVLLASFLNTEQPQEVPWWHVTCSVSHHNRDISFTFIEFKGTESINVNAGVGFSFFIVSFCEIEPQKFASYPYSCNIGIYVWYFSLSVTPWYKLSVDANFQYNRTSAYDIIRSTSVRVTLQIFGLRLKNQISDLGHALVARIASLNDPW
jgi:hypothetical protein